MSTQITHGDITVNVTRDIIDVTSSRETVDPQWKHIDRHGHEHHYDNGYPTLDLIVDAEHWCNGDEGYGDHDPHQHVDESHYECRQCHETITPGTLPPYWPQSIAGAWNATIKGTQTNGRHIEAWITPDQHDLLSAPLSTDWQTVLDNIPDNQIIASEYAR